MEEELCLVDSCTTNTILRETKYFQTLTKRKGNVMTIDGHDASIIGSRRATIILPIGTHIVVEDALLYSELIVPFLVSRISVQMVFISKQVLRAMMNICF